MIYLKKNTCLLLIFSLLLIACEKEVHDRYKAPKNLEGTIYKRLASSENHQLLVESIKVLKLEDLVDGRAAITVFAPNDAAINKWLEANGAKGIQDVDKDLLNNMVRLHFVENIFTEQQINMLNDNPIKRLKTYSQKPFSIEEKNGKQYHVHYENKMVSVFTPTLFSAEKLTDPNMNYQVVFDKDYNGKLMFGNAAVTESEIPCTNGYLYHIDEVVNTMENVEDWLKSHDDYNVMASLYERVKDYSYDAVSSQKYTQIADSIFKTKYRNAGQISAEVLSSDFITNMQDNPSYFMITDDVLLDYINTYLLNENVPTIDDISDITVGYLLGYLSSQNFAWPAKIQDKSFRNDFGSYFNFNLETELNDVAMCSNGLVYGIKKMPQIDMFSSIMRHAFTDPGYSKFLYAAEYADVMPELLNGRKTLRAYMPDNDVWSRAKVNINVGDPNVIGDEVFSIFDLQTGQNTLAGRGTIKRIVYSHILENVKEVGDNMIIGETMNDYDVVIFNKSQIMGAGNYHLTSSPVNVLDEGIECSNGEVFKVDDLVMPTGMSVFEIINKKPEYSEFNKLMQMVDGYNKNNRGIITSCPFIQGYRFTTFIPTNDVLLNAISENKVPIDVVNPDISDEIFNDPNVKNYIKYKPLADWLSYYFVKMDGTFRTNYYLPYEELNAPFSTSLMDKKNSTSKKTVYYDLFLQFNEDAKKVKGIDGQEANLILDQIGLSSNALIYSIDNVVSYH
ncbi:fasciclin domain-containing protein [Saccharicrinis sp. GN24d3]|uniref:fasciclin domain-containing protein n=1 Tax=Saccharicrinis sp. GN24d3 TaxID=3458416 RepID=UPI004036DF32